MLDGKLGSAARGLLEPFGYILTSESDGCTRHMWSPAPVARSFVESQDNADGFTVAGVCED